MKKFILLLNHDDISLSAYLQHCLGNGEQFTKNSGNIFTFSRQEPSEEKIAAITYVNEDPDLKMKFQLEDYCALMKKRGWKILDIGKPEDIFDSKRHVFMQTDQSEDEFPLTDPGQAKKANKREKQSLIRCFCMLLLMLGFGIFFVGHDPDVILSSNHILFCSAAVCICWIISLVYCIKGTSAILRKAQCENGFRNYLAVDKAVLFCMISAAFLMVSLIYDLFLFPDTGRVIVQGDQRITVYQDELPLTMEDLNISKKGRFHSSRLTKREGLLMSSIYAVEQSFSNQESVTDLSLLSYSLFRSDFQSGLDLVTAKKGYGQLPEDEQMAVKWKSNEVHTDGQHRLSAKYPGMLLVLSTSADIKEIDPEIIFEKLNIN